MVSIGLDRALLPILAETMAAYSNVEIVPGDVTRLDLKALIGEKFAGLRPIVCANLPYNITTPVLTALVDIPAIESLTVLIQQEAAQRLTSANGRPDVIILDPPRAGVDQPVIDVILRAAPERIVSVSCHPLI